MDHNSYAMRNLGYNSRNYERTQSRSCSSYVQYFLLSTSIIQLLIIMGLVLFMTYGNNHSSQQNHLESTQNQSIKFISEINKLHGIVGSQKRDLKAWQYRSGNLSIQLAIVSRTLQSCISKVSALPNTTNRLKCLPPFTCFDASDPSWKMVTFATLQTNYSIVQKKLADVKAENELNEAKHMLEETKLKSQKRVLLKQLEDLRENCTSMSRDFQEMMDTTRANYEAGFRSLTEGLGRYDSSLSSRIEQIRANCTPLSSNFKGAIQQKLAHFDEMIKGMWQDNNERNSRIGTLEKMNEECKRDAAAQLNQFKKKESALQEHEEKFLAEKVQLLEERNNLRNQLATTATRNQQPDYSINQGPIKTPSPFCSTEKEALANARATIRYLEEKSKTSHAQQVATLRKQLDQQIASCSNLIEQGKRLGCRMAG